MPTKYQCKSCTRSFVHKETLKEHKLLHGLVILDSNKFSCPICQCEVTCQSGLHQHGGTGNNYLRTRAQAVKYHQTQANNHTSSDEAALENGENSYRNSKVEGMKLRLKNRNTKLKDMPETDVSDASGAVSCKICSRSFVYQKCLQKHTALVHGLSSEDRPKAKMKSEGPGGENSILPHKAKGNADRQESAMRENIDAVSDSQNAVDTLSSDGEYSPLDNTKESLSEIPARRISSEVGKSAELKVSPSDLKCKTCLKQFKHKAMLLRHMHMIHGETDFERCMCPLCSQKFGSQWAFSKHFDVEHKTKANEFLASLAGGQLTSDATDSSVDISRCNKCTQWFTCWRSYQKHCSLKHRSELKFTRRDELNHRSIDSIVTPDTDQETGYHEDRKPCEDRTVYGSSKPLATECENGLSSDKTVQDISESDRQRSSKYVCSVCHKTFVTANFLQRHMRIKHSSSSGESSNSDGKLECKRRKQTFVCGYCSQEFNKEDTLAEHVDSCHKSHSIDTAECACPVCGCSCPNQMLFSMHYDATHCVNSALNLASTTAVLPESVSSPVCRCNICELWFTSEEVLAAHCCSKQTPVRQPPKTGRARYRCVECGEAFEILRRFLHHRKVKHRVLGPNKSHPQPTSVPLTDLSSTAAVDVVNGLDETASQCIRGRPLKSSDVQVKQDDDDPKQNNTVQKQQEIPDGYGRSSSSEGVGLSCPECRRMFSTVAQLRRHRKSEHRNRTCQLCGETCKSADMVYYHNLKYHHEQKCEVCGASCSGRLGLIDHFRAQHPTEPPPLINRKTLICEYCPRVFAGCASRLLRDHIESCHLGRVHLCDVCGKRLGSAQTLAVHRRMHDPVARFECRECNRRFPHNTNLMNHIRKHHPDRLPAKYVREFRCEVCLMKFGSSSGLSRHRSEKHGSQHFQCDMCLRVFPSATGMRVHKRRDHQPKETLCASNLPTPPSAVAAAEVVSSPLPPPQVVTQFSADPTNAIMAGFMANMIGLPGLGQTFQ